MDAEISNARLSLKDHKLICPMKKGDLLKFKNLDNDTLVFTIKDSYASRLSSLNAIANVNIFPTQVINIYHRNVK